MNRSLKSIVLPPYFSLLRMVRKVGLLHKPLIKICISTNVKYAANTVPDLVKSLLEAGIKNQDIYVIEGGHTFCKKLESDINYFLTDHNSFDLTSLIEVSQMDVNTDYWFLLHDTCIVGKNFRKMIHNIPHYLPEVLCIKNFPSMNIGAYHVKYLSRKKSLLLERRNRNYSPEGILEAKKKAVKEEDILFRQPDIRNKIWVFNPWLLREDENYKISSIDSHLYYSNRVVEYFPQVDLYKYKANFNINQSNVIDL